MSLLKPRDIANVQFRTAWRGYNEADVDDFVQKMVSAYETLYHEYQQLQERTSKLQSRLDEYSQTEMQIDETLAFAKQAARTRKKRRNSRPRPFWPKLGSTRVNCCDRLAGG